MKGLIYHWSRNAFETCYLSFIHPIIEYGDVIFHKCTIEDSSKIDTMQLDAAHIVLGTKCGTSRSAMYLELRWAKLCDRRNLHKLLKVYYIVNKLLWLNLLRIMKYRVKLVLGPMCINVIRFHFEKNTFFQKSFVISGMATWNQLHSCIKFLPSESTFKNHVIKLTLEPKLPLNHNI